jgi:hypothetical protein
MDNKYDDDEGGDQQRKESYTTCMVLAHNCRTCELKNKMSTRREEEAAAAWVVGDAVMRTHSTL